MKSWYIITVTIINKSGDIRDTVMVLLSLMDPEGTNSRAELKEDLKEGHTGVK